MDMNLSKLREVVHDREAWRAQWSQKSRTQLSNWTTKTTKKLQRSENCLQGNENKLTLELMINLTEL